MYQPKITDEHIHALYQWAKRLGIPMTRLVNALLAHAIERLEKGVEHVNDPSAAGYHVTKRGAQYRGPEPKRTSRH